MLLGMTHLVRKTKNIDILGLEVDLLPFSNSTNLSVHFLDLPKYLLGHITRKSGYAKQCQNAIWTQKLGKLKVLLRRQ